MPSKKRREKSQITLARALSKLGFTSRKQAAELVHKGRVGVNAKTVHSPQLWIDPRRDRVTVDGKVLHQQEHVYLVMNKPAGLVTTRSDELGRKTVYDLLPDDSRWLFPIGRLDKDTSGLLLFTNDTRFGDNVTSPIKKIPKTYLVEVNKPFQPGDRRRMESHLVLDDGTKLQPARVEVDMKDPLTLRITIVEGKNRQIRRMLENLGYEVRSLCRVGVGSIRLGTLREGYVRPLTEAERSSLVLPSI